MQTTYDLFFFLYFHHKIPLALVQQTFSHLLPTPVAGSCRSLSQDLVLFWLAFIMTTCFIWEFPGLKSFGVMHVCYILEDNGLETQLGSLCFSCVDNSSTITESWWLIKKHKVVYSSPFLSKMEPSLKHPKH